MKRILITGSRTWDNWPIIRHALVMHEDSSGTMLVSGGCPNGADAICESVAAALGWPIERHAADWRRYGKRAGLARNREMVARGADLCLAFQRDGSRGTQHTIDLCSIAGIPTVVYGYEPVVAGG